MKACPLEDWNLSKKCKFIYMADENSHVKSFHIMHADMHQPYLLARTIHGQDQEL